MTEEMRMREKSTELGNGDEDKVSPRGWPWERGCGGAGSTGRGAERVYLPYSPERRAALEPVRQLLRIEHGPCASLSLLLFCPHSNPGGCSGRRCNVEKLSFFRRLRVTELQVVGLEPGV